MRKATVDDLLRKQREFYCSQFLGRMRELRDENERLRFGGSNTQIQNSKEAELFRLRGQVVELSNSLRSSQLLPLDLEDQLSHIGLENERLRGRNEALNETVKSLRRTISHLENERAENILLSQLRDQEEAEERKRHADAVRDLRVSYLAELHSLRARVCSLRSDFSLFVTSLQSTLLPSFSTYLTTMQESLHHSLRTYTLFANEQYQRTLSRCRSLSTELDDLYGRIQVFVRVRPPLASHSSLVLLDSPDSLRSSLSYSSSDSREITCTVHRGLLLKEQMFQFDRIFRETTTQSTLFRQLLPRLVSTSLETDFRSCLFCYGPTGSGKTFTMEGTKRDPGIIVRMAYHLFDWINGELSECYSFEVYCQIVEIYKNELFDLMDNDSSSSSSSNKLNLNMTSSTPSTATSIHITSVRQLRRILTKTKRKRATASTDLNPTSSRSHCIVSLTLNGTNRLTSETSQGRIHLVDLAGSERVKRTGSDQDRDRFAEAIKINSSLSALSKCLLAIKQGNAHIPFRDTMLTSYLSDVLTDQRAKAVMLANVGPEAGQADETLLTLQFASRVKTIGCGSIVRNYHV